MKTYVKSNGTKVVVDGNICYAESKIGKLLIGSENGTRGSTTLKWAKNGSSTPAAVKGRIPAGSYALPAYSADTHSFVAYVEVDADMMAFFEEFWTVTLSDYERWQAVRPESARLMCEYNTAMAEYHMEQDRRFGDESLSSILVPAPKIKRPELTADGAAWLRLEAMSCASNHAKVGAAKKAIKRVIDGTSTLESAAADADAEWSAYCESHIFD